VVKVEQQRDGGVGQQQEPGILALPAHAWLLGKYASFTGSGALRPECNCWRKFDAEHQSSIGPHACWDCPLRYIAQCGYCPGFTINGLRLRNAWIDHDTMTAETVAEWKHLIEVKDLKPARSVRGAGAPKFP
jgi:hypothetical protein